MNDYISAFAESNKEFEIREITGKFSLDALANCVFGFQTDSFEKQNSPLLEWLNGFFQTVTDENEQKDLSTAKRVLHTMKDLKVFLDFYLPTFIKKAGGKLGLNFFGHFLANDYAMFLMQKVERRRASEKKNNNLVGMMMESIEKKSINIFEDDSDEYEIDTRIPGKYPREDVSSEDVVATALLMLSAGYDTTGTSMAFVLYDLATNEECQDELLKEIKTTKNVDDMPYLEAVIHESMRKHPILANLERVCTKEYSIDGLDGKDYVIREGDMIRVSNIGICNDEDIFPDPQKFRPERFLDDQEDEEDWSKRIYKNKNPLAFSLGPRNCLGMKFAMLEMKLGIIGLIREFRLIPGESTPEEIEWNPLSILGLAKDGLWIKCERR